MEILKKIKSVLFQPSKFFESLKKEKGVKEAFKYFLVLSFVSTILGIIAGRLFYDYYMSLMNTMYGGAFPMPQQTIESIVIFPFVWFIFGLFLSFIIAGILHVWILIFGGKEDYAKTYQLWIYSITPGLALGWIPFVAFFAWIYNLFLLILGTQKVHGISRSKEILMYVLPLVLIAIFMIICMIFFLSLVSTNPELFMNYTAMQ